MTTLPSPSLSSTARRRAVDVLFALAIVVASTGVGRLGRVNPTTAGFLFLVAVLGLAVSRGLAAALTGSVAATLAFNWFFFPPLHTFSISEPANWAALSSFLTVGVVASRLVVTAREKAAEILRFVRDESVGVLLVGPPSRRGLHARLLPGTVDRLLSRADGFDLLVTGTGADEEP